MRYPTLKELPPPPAGKEGWPWTEETPPLSGLPGDEETWPKISIITPSYNQGQFLEETIRSVLLQRYPNLEYIIMDGGSQDQSVEIIKKYEPWLSSWVSTKDNGQTDAINKGLNKSTGEILAYINSDDYYAKAVFGKIASLFQAHQADDFITGACLYRVTDLSTKERFNNICENFVETPLIPANRDGWLAPYSPDGKRLKVYQPSTFWRRSAYEALKPFDESYHYCFDREYWIRALFMGKSFLVVDEVLSNFRLHDLGKTVTDQSRFAAEYQVINQHYKRYLTHRELVEHAKTVQTVHLHRFRQELDAAGSLPAFLKILRDITINSKFSPLESRYWLNMLLWFKALASKMASRR